MELQQKLDAARVLVAGLPVNTERTALDAAHWKRLAAVSDPNDWQEYVGRAFAGYLQSALYARDADNGTLDLYGFRNALQLAELDDQGDAVCPLLDGRWLEAWNAELEDEQISGEIWRRVGKADGRLTAALLAPDSRLRARIVEMEDKPALGAALRWSASTDEDRSLLSEITRAYKDAAVRGRDERAWQSVLEHIASLSGIAALAGRHALVEWLDALREGLEA